MQPNITLRSRTPSDYPEIADMVLRSFKEGTNYSDGTGPVALEEIRGGPYPRAVLRSRAGWLHGGPLSIFQVPPVSHRTGQQQRRHSCWHLMLAPVAVHADYLRRGIGRLCCALASSGLRPRAIRHHREGNYQFYNRVGFVTSSEYGIYPTSGRPLEDARYMMCQECYTGALKGIGGYIVYDMYQNA